jgi:hypothetical protein
MPAHQRIEKMGKFLSSRSNPYAQMDCAQWKTGGRFGGNELNVVSRSIS